MVSDHSRLTGSSVVDWAIVLAQQLETCRRNNVLPVAAPRTSIAGVGGTRGELPLNGLRHPPTGNHSGWYIWTGETLSSAIDFFQSTHVEHLADDYPELLPCLSLPAGWRFLIAPGYGDVWLDENLLNV